MCVYPDKPMRKGYQVQMLVNLLNSPVDRPTGHNQSQLFVHVNHEFFFVWICIILTINLACQ